MQRILMMLCSLLLAISLMACNIGDTQPTSTSEISSLEMATTPPVASSIPAQEVALPKPPPHVQTETKPTMAPIPPEIPKGDTVRSMQITVGNKTFSATLAENATVDALIELMRNAPVVINMSDYSGFEKVGSLGTSISTSNSDITTSEGDIVLYNGNQIVVFYGSNSWSYTRIGKIDDLSGWKESLGNGDVTITFSIK